MSGFRFQTHALGLIIGFLVGNLIVSTAYGASTELTRQEMAALASRIVVGEVTAVESFWNNARNNIHTVITLKVEADLKNPQTPAEIQIRVPGGRVGDIGQLVVGTSEFSLHERVIVFLNEGFDEVIGQAQGKFSISQDAVVGTRLKLIDFIDEIRCYVKKQQPAVLGATKGTVSLQQFPERSMFIITDAKTIARYDTTKSGEPDVKSAAESSRPSTAAGWMTIFYDGFEESFPGSWVQSWKGTSASSGYGYTWGDVSYEPAAGNRCVWCADDSKEGLPDLNPPGDYPNNANSRLIYGPFSIPAGATAQVRFKLKNESEENRDYVHWAASTNNTIFFGYKFSGSTDSWVDRTFDLNNVPTLGNLAGSSHVWIAFAFLSDGSNTFSGAFIDDVNIEYKALVTGPDITTVTPSKQSAGTNSSVTITGINFGATQETSTVSFPYYSSKKTAIVTSWSDTQIICTVPYGACSGEVTVQTAYGTDSYDYEISFGYGGMRWPGSHPIVSLEINENYPGVTNAGTEIIAAAMSWNLAGDSNLGFAIAGATSVTSTSLNNHNEILWNSITPTSTIAQTSVYYNGDTKEIVECDLAFNSQLPWGIGQSASYFDIQNIATHELMHFHNLSDLFGAADVDKTMYGYSGTDEIKKRTLEADDIAGAQWIYGQNSNTRPSITISTPASYTTVSRGASCSIQWVDSDPDDNASISLAYDTDDNYWNGGGTVITTTLTEDADGTSDTYSWNTTGVAPGTYFIWASISDRTNPPVYAVSAGTVTIAGVTPPVTLTAPNGGESWVAGTVQYITWTSSGLTKVKIQYSTDNGSIWSTIINSTAARAGIYAWTVPVVASPQCLVRINDASDETSFDQSNAAFAITLDSTSSINPYAAASSFPAGAEIPIQIKVGSPNAVFNLFRISFDLKSDNTYCTYVDGSSAAGDFLGTYPRVYLIKRDNQTVNISIDGSSFSGSSGNGVVASAKFITPANMADGTIISFSLLDINGFDHLSNPIPLRASPLAIKIISTLAVWPGDCDNNGTIGSADVLKIGLHYGQSRSGSNNPGTAWQAYERQPWSGDQPAKKIYADADGDGDITSSDMGAVELHYDKTHPLEGTEPKTPPEDQSTSVGEIELVAVNGSGSNGEVPIDIRLTTSMPVFGVAMKLAYAGDSGISGFRLETGGGVLGEVLQFSRYSPEKKYFDLCLTRTQGEGFSGLGILGRVYVQFKEKPQPVFLNVVDITANDAAGNALKLDGKGTGITSVMAGLESLPDHLVLESNYPNPFNPATTISYSLPVSGEMSLTVYDYLGRQVRRLKQGMQTRGNYSIIWDGKDQQGNVMASGAYLCVLTHQQGESSNRKIQVRQMRLIK